MKRISPPAVDDLLFLRDVIGTDPKKYGEIAEHIFVLKRRYEQYEQCGGDPWLLQHEIFSYSTLLLLKELYGQQPVGTLTFIDDYRKSFSKTICPLCGSSRTGTLDHYLPKTGFEQFSVFSKNLVPACQCNQKKGRKFKDENPPGRIIHPYFDDFLDGRLYRSKFVGDFESPAISLVVADAEHPNIEILEFHLETVVSKSIEGWLDERWSQLVELPEAHLWFLPDGNIRAADVRDAIEVQVDKEDRRHSTPNNWESMFLAGILPDRWRLEELSVRVNHARGY